MTEGIDFLDSMILSPTNNISSIFDYILENDKAIMSFQDEKLKNIARFDEQAILKFSNLLINDGIH